MGNWTPTVKSDPIEFDGDLITITAYRLSVEDMLSLTKHMTIEPDGTTKISFKESIDVCIAASNIFPTSIVNVEGMTLGDDVPVNKEKLCGLAKKEFYFVPLLGKILEFLMKVSSIKEEDEGE